MQFSIKFVVLAQCIWNSRGHISINLKIIEYKKEWNKWNILKSEMGDHWISKKIISHKYHWNRYVNIYIQ